jgi:hypothetical protein
MSDHRARGSGTSLTAPQQLDRVLVGYAVLVIILLLIWPFKDVSLGGDHYVFLARRLLQGSLNVDNLPPEFSDYVSWQGHKYLALGPVPALLLVPFIPLMNAGMPMVWVGYAFTAINVLVFYRVLALAGVRAQRRSWTTLLYFAGTVYLSITLVGISTYFAHVVATLFLLLAVWEFLGKRRLLLVGLYVGMAAGARLTAAFTLPFFLWLLWSSFHPSDAVKPDVRTGSVERRSLVFANRAALLICGLAVPMLFLAVYNYSRFGSPTETGFGMTDLYHPTLEAARSVGMFSLAHVPKNLLMMLLQSPQAVGGEYSPVLRFPYIEPSPWGMGLFFTSPALLYIFRARVAEHVVQACWLAILTTMVPILTYYGIGYVQFGYRYALDFMPFLVLLAGLGFPDPMTTRARVVVGASVLINVWGAAWLAVWL